MTGRPRTTAAPSRRSRSTRRQIWVLPREFYSFPGRDIYFWSNLGDRNPLRKSAKQLIAQRACMARDLVARQPLAPERDRRADVGVLDVADIDAHHVHRDTPDRASALTGDEHRSARGRV